MRLIFLSLISLFLTCIHQEIELESDLIIVNANLYIRNSKSKETITESLHF